MKFQIPVENCFITSHFNEPRNYPYAPKRKQFHEGIDYAPAWEDRNKGFLVYSAGKGTVHDLGYDQRGYGNYVRVKHSDRFYTVYCHLQEKCQLPVATQVSTDTVLGIMGKTGNATGKHLHFNVQDYQNGLSNYVYPMVVDPEPLMVDKIDYLQVPEVVYNVIKDYMTLKE